MPRRNTAQGFSLIELMIALVLGLLVVGAAIGIFLSNQRTFRSAQNLGSVQESARTAFELMARDLREAAGNPCVNNAPVGNVLAGASGGDWFVNFFDWGATMQGYGGTDVMSNKAFGTAQGERVAGTDAIQIISGGEDVATINAHDTAGAVFTVTGSHDFAKGDLMIACNARQASIFQASAATGTTVSHGVGGGVSPGNCTAGLSLQQAGVCNAAAKAFQYEAPNSVLTKLHAVRWYIGNNGNGNSLYQSHLSGGNAAAIVSDEIVEGVDDMKITYLLQGENTYKEASLVGAANWANVVSMRVDLTIHNDNTGADGSGNAIERQLIQVASLRNRNP